MKILLWILVSACLAVVVISISEDHQKLKDKRKKAVEECRKENPNATEEDFSALKVKDDPKTEIQHCLFQCVYEKVGILKDGKLNKDEINKVTDIRNKHNETLFKEEDYLSRWCQAEVEKNYAKIGKCGVANAYHSCVGKLRATRKSHLSG
ncbi:uncharacterized protein LOC135833252 [Planococcus citri]|uniref:uncharacterized protein LOC135833252 n=1 Tax=Planococcus citri TaxID=170843 RepID=UPI0031F8C17E